MHPRKEVIVSIYGTRNSVSKRTRCFTVSECNGRSTGKLRILCFSCGGEDSNAMFQLYKTVFFSISAFKTLLN